MYEILSKYLNSVYFLEKLSQFALRPKKQNTPNMASRISAFNIESAIIPGDVNATAHIPGENNIFPKYASNINDRAWEIWCCEGINHEGAGVMFGFQRAAFNKKMGGGWRVQVIAVWPDGKNWYKALALPESVFEESTSSGDISSVWSTADHSTTVSFNYSKMEHKIDVFVHIPGFATGSASFKGQPGDSGLDTSPELGPYISYLRPVGRADVTSKMVFHFADASTRTISFSNGHGGFDRYWGEKLWLAVQSESYFMRSFLGPYVIQIIRLVSTEELGHQQWPIARLFHQGELVCAPQRCGSSEDKQVSEDTLLMTKVYETGDGALSADFHDKSTGYDLTFIEASGQGRKWTFKVKHQTKIWSLPIGPKGGNSGFVELVSGGLDEETYTGLGISGQIVY